MNENTQLTMKDIARELGISVATVSRALKDSPRISVEQRKRIQDYARAHNFTPNLIAESLRHSKVQTLKVIGVIVPELVHYYFASILKGIEEEAEAHGYRVMVGQSGEQYEREVKLCRSFYENKVCGIIVSQAKDTLQYDHFKQLITSGVPLVFYDRICTGVNASRVVGDDYMGSFNAVTYLINTGCRHIAFYGLPMHLEIAKNRFNGYKDALLKHGLRYDERLVRICDNRDDAEVITPELFNRFAREAGAYVGTRTGVQLDMNGDFVSIHCLRPGRYDFRLPFPCRVVNLKSGVEEQVVNGVVPLVLTAGETCWLRLEKKGKMP